MSRNTLRPCLKHNTDLDPPAPANSPFPFALPSAFGPRVHFPPPQGLCQTHLTHSPSIYDRAPIVVLPNACALPERHERTYTPSSEHTSPRKRRPAHSTQGVALHPNVFSASVKTQPAPSDSTGRVPSLVPDLSSSESDESDISSSTPPDPRLYPSTGHPPITIVDGTADAATLSFLPHANDREKPRRERSRSRSRGSPRSVRKSEFAVPELELDGCLGGF
jgi:hypothetical protein